MGIDRSFVLAPGPATALGLGFWARSIVIQSGQNWVGVLDTGEIIPPRTFRAVVALQTATQVGKVLVTSGPAFANEIGDPGQTATIVQWTSDALPPSPGVSAPAQPLGNTLLSYPGGLTQLDLAKGQARMAHLVIQQTGAGGATVITITGLDAAKVNSIPLVSQNTGVNSTLGAAFGQTGAPSGNTFNFGPFAYPDFIRVKTTNDTSFLYIYQPAS